MSKYFLIGIDKRPVTGLKYAIVINVDFDFDGSGLLFPPTIVAQNSNGRRVPPLYNEVQFILVSSQEEAAKAFNVTQQTISRYIERGKAKQK